MLYSNQNWCDWCRIHYDILSVIVHFLRWCAQHCTLRWNMECQTTKTKNKQKQQTDVQVSTPTPSWRQQSFIWERETWVWWWGADKLIRGAWLALFAGTIATKYSHASKLPLSMPNSLSGKRYMFWQNSSWRYWYWMLTLRINIKHWTSIWTDAILGMHVFCKWCLLLENK